MAPASRRPISSFSLSFLDIMFCGFGAVVLLVLIINSNVVKNRQAAVEDRRLEYMKQEFISGQMRDEEIHKTHQLQQFSDTLLALRAETSVLEEDNAAATSSISDTTRSKRAEEQIASLQQELRELDKQKSLLEAQKQQTDNLSGRNVRKFIGQGDRQYLTGLKLGGKRILVLIDSSASMLDRKIVDIIRLKLRSDTIRRTAPKWQKTVSTVEWLLANLPPESSVQLYQFNKDVTSLASEPHKGWIRITNAPVIDQMIKTLRQVAPSGGTNLESVFKKVRTLAPRPDNIILLTDGLPTRGERKTSAKTVSSEGRVRLFQQAVKQLPGNVPVNTILFPIEGDPLAPVMYWKLAIDSGGSFLTPTRDWP